MAKGLGVGDNMANVINSPIGVWGRDKNNMLL